MKWFTMHCSALNYTTMHCTALHCTALHCTARTVCCHSKKEILLHITYDSNNLNILDIYTTSFHYKAPKLLCLLCSLIWPWISLHRWYIGYKTSQLCSFWLWCLQLRTFDAVKHSYSSSINCSLSPVYYLSHILLREKVEALSS